MPDNKFAQPASAITLVEPGYSSADRVYALEEQGLSREEAVLQAALERVELEELLGIDYEIDDEDIALSFDPNQPRDAEGKWTDADVSFISATHFEKGQERQIPTEEAQRRLQKLGLSSKSIASAVGAPDGAKVTVQGMKSSGDYEDGVIVRVSGDDDSSGTYNMERMLYRKGGERYATNVFFAVQHTGNGFGVQALTRQVETLSKVGFAQIETHAARDDGDGDEGAPMVGYKVWPRLGYDAKVPDWVKNDIARNRIKNPAITEAKYISDLMKTPEGRNFWDEFGEGEDMQFDLREGSLSRKILAAYNERKKNARPNK